MTINTALLKSYFTGLQARIVGELESFDGQSFRTDSWDRPEGGGGISRLIEEGNFFERGGVNFSHVTGKSLPASATAVRPQLAGRAWEAMGVSLVMHPRNPYCPTTHMNVRCFVATKEGEEDVWWFGGGTDISYPELLSDTWEWDGAAWTRRTPARVPPATRLAAVSMTPLRIRLAS